MFVLFYPYVQNLFYKNNSPTGHKSLKRSGNYGFCLLFVLAMAMSCVTEEEPAPVPLPENPTALVDTRQVKDWFEKNEPGLNDRAYDQANARKSDADKFMVPFVEKLPDWGRVHSFRFSDGRQVYEVALDNTDLLVVPRPVREALGDENIGEKINQSLLFIEAPGGYRVLLARYYPASEEDVRGFDGLQYNLLSEGWSGVVDIYSFEEAHVRNFMVSEGLTVLSRTYRPAGSGSSSRGEGCYNIWIDFPTYGIPGGVGSKRPMYVMVCAEYDIPIGPIGGGSGTPYHGFYPPSGGGSGSYGSAPSGGGGPSGAGGIGCMDGGTYCFDPPGETEQEQIEKTTDPDTKRKKQLNFMRIRGGREFVEIVEAFLETPGLTVGEVSDVNKLVNDAYINLVNEYFDAIFGTVAHTAKPFIELALFNSISDVALKGITAVLNSKWGVDLYNSIKGLKGANITQVTFETISISEKLIEFRVGMKRVEFMANMEKVAKPITWKPTKTPGIFTMEFNGLKYSVRPFSKSAGSTVEVFKNSEKIAKYRLMD